MLLDFLSTYFRREVDEGWGALEMGAFRKAEEHFRNVIESVHDPRITVFDLAEAHNGMGALNALHSDWSEADRWYHEAFHILDEHFHHDFPERLHWWNYHERSLMRVLMALGHTAYRKKNAARAREYYEMLRSADPQDELGAGAFLRALESGQTFEQAQHDHA
jgi:tetratricopeptide (TPR) repeat protein